MSANEQEQMQPTLSDDASSFESLLRTYTTDESQPASLERARAILNAYRIKYWNQSAFSGHPVFALIRQQTSPRLKVLLILAILQYISQNRPVQFYLEVTLIRELLAPDLPYTGEDIRALLGLVGTIFVQMPKEFNFWIIGLALADSLVPWLKQPEIQAASQNELMRFCAQVRAWEDIRTLPQAYHTRQWLNELLVPDGAPGLASLLSDQANGEGQPVAEWAQILFAAYRREVGDTRPEWYGPLWPVFHPALELLQQSTGEHVKVQLILLALQELNAVFYAENWQKRDISLRQIVALIAVMSTKDLSYSAEDIQCALQALLRLLSLTDYTGAEATINEVIFGLLCRWEPQLRQADVFARCQVEVTALYDLSLRWSSCPPLEIPYNTRMMLGNLLFADSPPGLASLLRAYAQDEGPSIAEQSRACLAAYHQEMGDYAGFWGHPVQDLLAQEAYPRLKVQLARDAFEEMYASYQPQPYVRQSTIFEQAMHLFNVLFSPDLPYRREDVQALLEILNRILALPDYVAYKKFDAPHPRSDERLLSRVFGAIAFWLKQPELLDFCHKEATHFYNHLSHNPWAWVNIVRLHLRGLLFPDSAGPLLDLVRSTARFESNSELAALLVAYHQELAWYVPYELEPDLLKLMKRALTPETMVRFLRLIAEEGHNLQAEAPESQYLVSQNELLIRALYKKTLLFSPEDIHAILQGVLAFNRSLHFAAYLMLNMFASQLNQPEVLELCYSDLETIQRLAQEQNFESGSNASGRRFWLMLQDLLSRRQQEFRYPLLPDAWASPILEELAALSAEERDPWLALLNHCVQATTVTPSVGWQDLARSLVVALPGATFTRTLHRWISFFSDKKGGRMDGNNSDILRGLLWLCIGSTDRALAIILANAAIEGYRKLPGLGPRSPKVGDAAVVGLEGMRGRDAIGQLERVRRNVKQPSYQAKIGQALDAVAQREQMSRIDLEELTVPTFDLCDGQLRVPVGTWAAELTVASRGIRQRWLDPAGNPQNSVPASVKREAKEVLKDLAGLVTDIEHLVADQRNRLERLFLNMRHWTLEDWRERYLEHPLLRVLARQLIWQVRSGSQSWQVIWHGGTLVDVDTQPVELPMDAEVQLWHPLMSDPQEVQRWCLWLETHHVTQPFKQAHREIYPLTEAERAHGLVSQRFAGHIIRQHQLNALARARGWSFSLHSNFSGAISDDPVTLELPHLGIRAEFEVRRLPDEDESISRYLTTSQVCFPLLLLTAGIYHHIMELEPLEQVPPLVFSEVMRDIDLFVSVTSIGADPHEYTQAGPLQEYWHTYNQERLASSGRERKQLLERLVPMLEIAERCTVEDRFLRVQGDLRTYHIHLGSGNVIMEPGPQYLCIVLDAKAQEATEERFFLPFEGDPLLALILSKAFLLAADTQIKDRSILSQLHR